MLTMWISQNRHERRLCLPRGSRSLASQRHRFRPRLEGLEERTVLSTLTVLNTLDKGAGSLRDTITNAKSGDTIVFDPSLDGQTITLTSDQITINKSVDIEGPGASLLAVSGNDTNRVFSINEGFTVTITGLTITHGLGHGVDTTGGGGILNVGTTLNLANDVLSYNTTVRTSGPSDATGGALSNINGAILAGSNCTFIGNEAISEGDSGAKARGGAIYNARGSTATVTGSTFTGNEAIGADGGVLSGSDNNNLGVGAGGGIYNDQGATLTVQNSTFTGNLAIGGNGGSAHQNESGSLQIDVGVGGGIGNYGGTLVMTGCTLSHNQAIGGSNATGGPGGGAIGTAAGGGVFNSGPATITNNTFIGNEALGGNDNSNATGVVGHGVGGAIQSVTFGGSPASLTVSGCTFTANQAVGGNANAGTAFVNEGLGGAIDNGQGATAAVTGSAFSGNQAIGGQGTSGQNGGNGLGGALSNFGGSTLTVSSCTLSGNSATGGAEGAGASGGNAFGGGIYNDGQSSLTILTSTLRGNQAEGGSAGTGGGLYLADGGVACLDTFTQANTKNNHATTDHDDIFGSFTTC
jgi:hypothetical protein